MRIYFPWNNLGCLGVRVGHLYFDFFRLSDRWWPSMFINFHGWWDMYRYRINLPWFWEIIPDRSNPDYEESSYAKRRRARRAAASKPNCSG